MQINYSKYFKENKWLFAILLLALLVRVIYFINVKPWERNYASEIEGFGDAIEYQLLAEKFVETGSYPQNFFLDTYRTPGFPVYAALIYFVFGIHHHYVLASYILLNLVIIFFIYLICIRLFEKKSVALISVLLFALEPNVIKLVTEYGTETLHLTIFIIAVYFFISAIKDNKISYYIISAFIFALTALIRPINLYYYLFCLIIILIFAGLTFSSKIKLVLIFGIVYFIAISPWMFRNYFTYGHFSTNAFQGTAAYYDAIITKSYATGVSSDSVMKEVIASINKICSDKGLTNPFDIDSEKEIYGFNYINQHKGAFITLHLKGMLNFFIAPFNNEKYSFLYKLLFGAYLSFIYLFALFGIYLMIKQKNYFVLLFFIGTIFYFCFITGMLGLARYRMPATPFYLILCAIGIQFTFEKLKAKLLPNKI